MKHLFYILCTITISILGSQPSFAQQKIGQTRGVEKSETLQIAELANQLVHFGQKNEDPYTLVAAAKLLLQYKVEDADKDRVEEGDVKSDAPEDASKGAGMEPIEFTASAILDKAASYAERNSPIIQVIEDLKKQDEAGSRGYAYGAGYIEMTETIPAYSSREFNWTFTGDEFAEILFVGDEDTDIDVYVYDSSTDELLGYDESYDSGAYFSWTPPYTKQYTFRVINRGGYDNSTYIISN